MLFKHDSIKRDQIEMITLDQLIQRTIWLVKWRPPLFWGQLYTWKYA